MNIWELKICKNYEHMHSTIVRTMRNYIPRNNIQSLILGLSGGIDSALVAVLARDVCDTILDSDVKLIGLSIPIESNDSEMHRAYVVGKEYCDIYEIQDMSRTYFDMIECVFPEDVLLFDDKIRRGNIKARLRMIKLFHEAHKNKGMVLSTDNLTEYYLGFWTLHGDVGNYGAIQNLWKTEVYGLSRYLLENHITDQAQAEALQACIKAVPTDGLGITDSDFDQLGIECYEEADLILQTLLRSPNLKSENPVVKRYRETEFKRNDPINIKRIDIVDSDEWG